jgi:hypothetical protein
MIVTIVEIIKMHCIYHFLKDWKASRHHLNGGDQAKFLGGISD